MILAPALMAAAGAAVAVGLPAPARLMALGVRPRRTPVTSRRRPDPGVLLTLAGAGVVTVALGPALAALALGAAVLGRRARLTRAGQRERSAERDQAVEACAVLAGELRSGRSPAEALGAAASVAAGPVASALEAAAGAARLGGDVPLALAAGAAASAVPAVLLGLSACWTVCSATGSGVAAAVDRFEEALRAEQAQLRAVDAELAGPRATAGLLAVLPLAGIGLAGALGAHPLRVLLETPVGLVALTAGLGLDLLGVWWTGRLVMSAGGAR